MKTNLILIITILLVTQKSFSQDETQLANHALFGTIGFGILDDESAIFASGIPWGVGYQRGIIWPNRMRLVLSTTHGAYSNGNSSHMPNAYVNSLNLKCNVNIDFVKVKFLSLFLGVGIGGNYTSGLVENDYYKKLNFLANGLFGFRFIPKHKRIGYELILLSGAGDLKSESSEFVDIRVLQTKVVVNINRKSS